MAKNLDYNLYSSLEELVEELHKDYVLKFEAKLENIAGLSKQVKDSPYFDQLNGKDKDFIRNLATKFNDLKDFMEKNRPNVNRHFEDDDSDELVPNKNILLNLVEYNKQLQFPDEDDKTFI